MFIRLVQFVILAVILSTVASISPTADVVRADAILDIHPLPDPTHRIRGNTCILTFKVTVENTDSINSGSYEIEFTNTLLPSEDQTIQTDDIEIDLSSVKLRLLC